MSTRACRPFVRRSPSSPASPTDHGFTNAVIRPPKGGRPGTAVVDASATAAPPGRSREPAPDKPDTSNGPKWIGGHVLNFD